MAPRETENNAYAKFWGALWHVMVFLEWSMAMKPKGNHRAYKEWAPSVRLLQQKSYQNYTCKNQWQSYSKS